MTIRLNEIYKLTEMMETAKDADDFVSNIEESDDYTDILDELWMDFKHILAENLRQAIEVGFDGEILKIDYGMSSEMVEFLQDASDRTVDIEINNF